MLNSNTSYFSVCFSENSSQFGGTGKYRETPIGTVLYFSSEEELRKLSFPWFIIDQLKTIEIERKLMNHKVNFALMTKK